STGPSLFSPRLRRLQCGESPTHRPTTHSFLSSLLSPRGSAACRAVSLRLTGSRQSLSSPPGSAARNRTAPYYFQAGLVNATAPHTQPLFPATRSPAAACLSSKR